MLQYSKIAKQQIDNIELNNTQANISAKAAMKVMMQQYTRFTAKTAFQ